jgi:hypothetical protein
MDALFGTLCEQLISTVVFLLLGGGGGRSAKVFLPLEWEHGTFPLDAKMKKIDHEEFGKSQNFKAGCLCYRASSTCGGRE